MGCDSNIYQNLNTMDVVWMNQVHMRQNVVGKWRLRGGFQVLLDPWFMDGVCSLSARFLHETSFMPAPMYGSETVIWKEKERSRIRAVHMDNLRALLGIRKMIKVPNGRIRELCGMTKGVGKVSGRCCKYIACKVD